jgi:hypothetical protein
MTRNSRTTRIVVTVKSRNVSTRSFESVDRIHRFRLKVRLHGGW